MEYRRLGRSGVRVSEVGLGGWLTHGRTISDDTTASIVRRAFDLGVNFFDTADVYNRGEAEISLGKAVKGIRREDLFVATKCFWPMSDGVNDRGLSRKHIVESVNASLKRLQMDYVDLMQFHRYDPDTPMEEMVRAIDDLVRQGKVHYWGVSVWSADQIQDVVRTSREWLCTLPVSNQPPYNMFARDIEADVIPTSEKLGLGQVVFSPLAQGILTGKYKPGQGAPAGSRGADETSNQFMANLMRDEVLSKVEQLAPLAAHVDLTLGQFALAWCLRQPNVSSVIVGATRIEQLEENVGAAGREVPAKIWTEVERILAS